MAAAPPLRLLIVSPHFVPVNAADMHRVRLSLPQFVARGAEITVLTIDDPTPIAPLDPELASSIPAEVRIIRASCLSRRWTRFLGINSPALRALPFLFFTGVRLLFTRQFDAVYFSTTMFVVLPFGRIWRLLGGPPYVIDLQDPWLNDYYEKPGAPPPPGGWKYRITRSLDSFLEGWTLRGASHVISVSSAYIETLRIRYAWFSSIPTTVLPFGSADRDLLLVRSTIATRSPLLPPSAAAGLRLAYVGRLGPDMLPALRVLFCGLTANNHTARNVTVHFFGTSYAPTGEGKSTTESLATEYGLANRIMEQSNRIGYFSAIQVMLEAEAVLVLGSDDPAYMPSKLLGVLASGRPVLVVAPQGGQLANRAAQLPGVNLATFTLGATDLEADGIKIANCLASLPPPSVGFTTLSSDDCADRQLAILSKLAIGNSVRPPPR